MNDQHATKLDSEHLKIQSLSAKLIISATFGNNCGVRAKQFRIKVKIV